MIREEMMTANPPGGFDDRNSYYDPVNPWGSVIVPNTGTQIRIQSISALGNFMQVQVRPAK